jgi:hypothetical protein
MKYLIAKTDRLGNHEFLGERATLGFPGKLWGSIRDALRFDVDAAHTWLNGARVNTRHSKENEGSETIRVVSELDALLLQAHVEPMLVVSTRHLPREKAAEMLSAERPSTRFPGLVFEDEYSWIFHVDPSEDIDTSDEHLAPLFQAARNNKCVWLKIDRDGLEIEGLKTYEW